MRVLFRSIRAKSYSLWVNILFSAVVDPLSASLTNARSLRPVVCRELHFQLTNGKSRILGSQQKIRRTKPNSKPGWTEENQATNIDYDPECRGHKAGHKGLDKTPWVDSARDNFCVKWFLLVQRKVGLASAKGNQ
jgi:hypothetical protein